MFNIFGFYKFINITKLKKHKQDLQLFMVKNDVRGALIIATDFFKKANQEKKIKTIIKPALESISILKKEKNIFDIIFIDADKDNYKKYYECALELTKKNGLIIIDNVLWYGEVADENNNKKYTKIIRDFNNHVKNDKKTEQVIIPLGDGFTVCRKL